jgi:plastocyanin
MMARGIGAGILLLMVGWLASCSGLPANTRSGAVQDITITEDRVSPEDLTVLVGDEVRWVNHRLGPAWIYFSPDDLDEISCSRGFSLFWAHEESAKIEPGQSVSICFGKVDEISYTVQTEQTVIRGSTAGEGGSFSIPKGINAAIYVKSAAQPKPQ